MNIKQDATLPAFKVRLESPPGTIVDLTGATVVFRMTNHATGVRKVDDAAVTVVDDEGGIVQYDWAAGDTDTIALYRAEWRVTPGGGGLLIVPSNDYMFVRVEAGA